MKIPKTSRSNVHHADVILMYLLDNILRVLCLPADGRKCCTAAAGAAEEDREGGVGWLAKWVSAMSNNLAIKAQLVSKEALLQGKKRSSSTPCVL